MSKRSVFTTITPLPAGLTRETVLDFLHNHTDMIDLNPLVIQRFPIEPPSNATVEERNCTWYTLKDRVSYLPGGLVTGEVTYNACFHDLHLGVQTHVYAPLGLDIREKWSIGGSLAHEPKVPQELGLSIPKEGLYLREDCDMRCNIFMTSFVKGTLKRAHAVLVDRLVAKAGLEEVRIASRIASRMASSRVSTSSRSVSTMSMSGGSVSTGFPSPSVSTFGRSDSLRRQSSDSSLSRYQYAPPRSACAELDNARPPPIQEAAQEPEEPLPSPSLLPKVSFEPAFQVSGFYAPERNEYVPYQQQVRPSSPSTEGQRTPAYVEMPMPPTPPKKPMQYAAYVADRKGLSVLDIHPALRPRSDSSAELPHGIAELEG